MRQQLATHRAQVASVLHYLAQTAEVPTSRLRRIAGFRPYARHLGQNPCPIAAHRGPLRFDTVGAISKGRCSTWRSATWYSTSVTLFVLTRAPTTPCLLRVRPPWSCHARSFSLFALGKWLWHCPRKFARRLGFRNASCGFVAMPRTRRGCASGYGTPARQPHSGSPKGLWSWARSRCFRCRYGGPSLTSCSFSHAPPRALLGAPPGA